MAPWDPVTIERPQFPVDDTFDTFGMGFQIGTYRGEGPLYAVTCGNNDLTCPREEWKRNFEDVNIIVVDSPPPQTIPDIGPSAPHVCVVIAI